MHRTVQTTDSEYSQNSGSLLKHILLQHIKVSFLTLLLLLLYAGVNTTSQASTDIEYTVHTGPNGYAPFVISEEVDGQINHSGIVIDLLDAFEVAYPRFKRKYVLLSRKRTNALMERGEVYDLMFNSPLFASKQVLEHYKFTDILFRTKDVVISKQKKQLDYMNAADLFSKQVVAIRGYRYAALDEKFDDGLIKDVRVNSHIQAIGMLENNRVDAYLGNVHVSPYYINQSGANAQDFYFSSTALFEFDLAFLIRQASPELYIALNTFIKAHKASGQLDEIVSNYIK